MAIVDIAPFAWPICEMPGNNNPTGTVSLGLTGSGHKYAVVFMAPKTGNIRTVRFRLGTITTATNTDVRLETVSAQFPTGTLVGANTNLVVSSGSLVASSVNTVTLTADAAVTIGDKIAIVIAPSGTPSYNINVGSTGYVIGSTYAANHNGTSWSVHGSAPPFVSISYDDGSSAYIPGLWYTGPTAVSFSSSSNPDEIGARFLMGVTCRVRGVWTAVDLDADCDMVLYSTDGVTALGTITLPSALRQSTAGRSPYFAHFSSPVTLNASASKYYLAMKPGASSVSMYYVDHGAEAQKNQLSGGTNWEYISAKDPSGTGSWTASATRYPLMGLLIDGIDGGGGGGQSVIFGG